MQTYLYQHFNIGLHRSRSTVDGFYDTLTWNKNTCSLTPEELRSSVLSFASSVHGREAPVRMVRGTFSPALLTGTPFARVQFLALSATTPPPQPHHTPPQLTPSLASLTQSSTVRSKSLGRAKLSRDLEVPSALRRLVGAAKPLRDNETLKSSRTTLTSFTPCSARAHLARYRAPTERRQRAPPHSEPHG